MFFEFYCGHDEYGTSAAISTDDNELAHKILNQFKSYIDLHVDDKAVKQNLKTVWTRENELCYSLTQRGFADELKVFVYKNTFEAGYVLADVAGVSNAFTYFFVKQK